MMLILEVMDKEPALRTVWGAALLLGLVGFLAARFRRWLVLPALGVIGVLAYWQLSELADAAVRPAIDRKSTRLNSSHGYISYAVFCLKKKKIDDKMSLYQSRQRLHVAER